MKIRLTQEPVRTGMGQGVFNDFKLTCLRLDDVRGRGVKQQQLRSAELVDIYGTQLRFHAEHKYACFPTIRPDFRKQSWRSEQVGSTLSS